MAQILSLGPSTMSPAARHRSSTSSHPTSTRSHLTGSAPTQLVNHSWALLQQSLKSNGRFSCLFSDSSKQEQARKALEGALGGKKTDFEKWDKEIKRREKAGGGDGSGGGGWFGWGRWFGDFDGDRFWQESQQTSLTILGIIVIYLIVAKGDVLLAVIFNPLLFALRGPRNGLAYLSSQIMGLVNPINRSNLSTIPQKETSTRVSAKESVVRKWASD